MNDFSVSFQRRNKTRIECIPNICDECDSFDAELRCTVCNVVLCSACFTRVHQSKSIQNHTPEKFDSVADSRSDISSQDMKHMAENFYLKELEITFCRFSKAAAEVRELLDKTTCNFRNEVLRTQKIIQKESKKQEILILSVMKDLDELKTNVPLKSNEDESIQMCISKLRRILEEPFPNMTTKPEIRCIFAEFCCWLEIWLQVFKDKFHGCFMNCDHSRELSISAVCNNRKNSVTSSGSPPSLSALSMNESNCEKTDTDLVRTTCSNVIENNTKISNHSCSNYSGQKTSISPEDVEPVTVCYAESPYKFFVHTNNHLLSLVNFQKHLDKADSWTKVTINELTKANENKVYAAKCKDEKWYRIVIRRLNGTCVKSRKIDIGDVELVSFRRVRKIPSDLPSLQTVPDLAIQCSLHECHSVASILSKSNVAVAFKDITKKNDIYMETVKQTTHVKEVNLYFMCNKLWVNCAEELLKYENGEYETQSFQNQTETVIQSLNCEPELHQYSYYDKELQKHDSIYVLVQNIDSIHYFYVIRANEPETCIIYQNMEEKLTKFFIDTTNYTRFEPPRDLMWDKNFDLALAVHSEDGLWKRAKCLRRIRTRYEVRFVDTGYKTTVSIGKIRILPGDFLKCKIRAINCFLNNFPKSYDKRYRSHEATRVFRELIENKTVRMNVQYADVKRLRYGVTLFLNIDSADMINVNEKVMELGYDVGNKNKAKVPKLTEANITVPAVKAKPDAEELSNKVIELKTGTDNVISNEETFNELHRVECGASAETVVTIVSYINPNEIYINFHIYDAIINKLHDDMMEFYTDNEKNETTRVFVVSEGMKCVIWLRNEDKWVRAVVQKEIDSENSEVLLTDFGKTEIVNVADIRNIPPIFSQIPDAVAPCRLAGLENESSWPENIQERMKREMTSYSTYYVKNYQGSESIVDGLLVIDLWCKKIDFPDPLDGSRIVEVKINDILLQPESTVQSYKKNDSETGDNDKTNNSYLQCENNWIRRKHESEPLLVDNELENNILEMANSNEMVSEHEDIFDSVFDNGLSGKPWLPARKLSTARMNIYPQIICDKGENIFFQTKDDLELLNKMNVDLNRKIQNSQIPLYFREWNAGDSCFAYCEQFPGWYRAEVLKIEDDKRVTVRYVDYGNATTLKPEILRTANFYHKIPILVHELRLRSDLKVANRTALVEMLKWAQEFFGQNMHEVILTKEDDEDDYRIYSLINRKTSAEFFDTAKQMKFLLPNPFSPKSRTKIQSINNSTYHEEYDTKITDSDSSIASIEDMSYMNEDLKNLRKLKEQSMIKLTLSQIIQQSDNPKLQVHDMFVPEENRLLMVEVTSMCSNNVVTIHLIDEDNVQLVQVRQNYLTMVSDIHDNAAQQPPLVAPYTGKLCCAKYLDDEWYRAIVAASCTDDNSKVTIYFIDYGNTEIALSSELRQMKEEWYQVPAQGIKCVFDLPYLESGKNKMLLLSELLLDRKLEAKITPNLRDKQLKYCVKFPVYEKKLIEAVLK